MKQSYKTRIRFISNFANQHIRSAISMTNSSFEIEKSFLENSGRFSYDLPYDLHRAYITSTIMLSVAFLEATINELIIGVSIGSIPWNNRRIGKNKLEMLKQIGNIFGDARMEILEKYQLVLTILEKPLIDSSKNPYQNVQLLIKLRNALVHFRPEAIMFIPENINEEHKLLVKLKNKFPENPVARGDNHLNYPDIMLGHGCAKWAVVSSINFHQEFSNRIKLPRNYGLLKKELIS